MNKNFFSFILMTVLFTAVLSSCKKDDTPDFSFTVSSDGNGTASATEEGELITLTATANSGYFFTEWQVIKGGITLSSKIDNPATFIMPNDEAVEVKAIFGLSVTVSNDKHGSASVSAYLDYNGEIEITLTETANSGYRFVEWQVTKGDITLNTIIYNNHVSFIMPNEAVEVKAIFLPSVGLPKSIIVSQDNYLTKYEYVYDSQNRITKSIRYSYRTDDERWDLNSALTLDYFDDKDLVELSGHNYVQPRAFTRTVFSKKSEKITYSYSMPTLTYYREEGELELNAQELPVKQMYKYFFRDLNSGDWIEGFIFTATYIWQNENHTKTDWESKNEQDLIAGTVTYTHDDKKTPFYRCNTPKWVLWWLYNCWGNNENYRHNENNIKTETREDGSIITYEYTYNDDGLPVTRTWVDGTTKNMVTYIYD